MGCPPRRAAGSRLLAGRVARGLLRKDGLIERIEVYQLPGTVGMIAPIQGDDGWVLGAGRGFVHLAFEGTQRTIAQVAPAGSAVPPRSGVVRGFTR